MIKSFFSLRKSKKSLRQILYLYKRKSKTLSEMQKETLENFLNELRKAILAKDSQKAKSISQELENATGRFISKNSYDKFLDFLKGIGVALFIAVLVRTMWFELYTIPSGSMRPTLKEEDYLVVSKTDYGINVPLQEKHFYFDPSLVQRGSVIVFNGANMDIPDADTTYFYLFPGKKQFVKRLIGKPGDTLYFYGGDVYGIDEMGNPLDLKAVNQIEHIPFIRFDGKVETPNPAKNGFFSPVIFHQMNKPVASLSITPIGTIVGEMIGEKGRKAAKNYSDLWGMKHFAMARILSKSELQKIHPNERIEEGEAYLEITHHPSINSSQIIRDENNRIRPDITTNTSIIALQSHHLETLSKHMTTCRFTVKNGIAYRLGWNPKNLTSYLPRLDNVPDGTYEIQNGKAYKLPFPTIPIIGLFTNGITKELDENHPLYSKDPKMIITLYNLGIEFMNHYLPSAKGQRFFPSRYTYFKNGDLYLLGSPIIKKEDPTLIHFVESELEKEKIATTVHPYLPFIDLGPPSLEEIQKNGILVPEKMYMALGDNHAMSSDSRQFGFVPEDNLKGGVSFIFSPPGARFGRVDQPKQPHATFPNLTIWFAFLVSITITSLYNKKKLKNPLKF